MRANSAALSFGLVFFLVWEVFEAVVFDAVLFCFVVDAWLLVFCGVPDSGKHASATTTNSDNLDQILTTSV